MLEVAVLVVEEVAISVVVVLMGEAGVLGGEEVSVVTGGVV
jgi:hypothetical protein